jgi:hypothetical protein
LVSPGGRAPGRVRRRRIRDAFRERGTGMAELTEADMEEIAVQLDRIGEQARAVSRMLEEYVAAMRAACACAGEEETE